MEAKSRPQLATLLICLMLIQASVSQLQICGPYEEGDSGSVSCTTTDPFETYGPRLEINDAYPRQAYCRSSGLCYTTDPSKYSAVYNHNETSGETRVFLIVGKITRELRLARCYKDDEPLFNQRCALGIYVKASKPVCEGPQFVDEDSVAEFTCTSERIYPSAVCDFQLLEGDSTVNDHLEVTKEESDSVTFVGDQEVTCKLRVPVTGTAEDSYRFQVAITPDLANIKDHATVYGDPMQQLDLSATALYDQAENGHQLDFPESSGQLTVDIHVTGNPGPNRFSLSVADEQGAAGVPLASGNGYEVTYTASVGAEGGVLSLLVKSGMEEYKEKFFTFTADNGIVGGAPFEYRFSVKGPHANVKASQPVCAGPMFVDQGTVAQFTCTSERVYPSGTCNFELLDGDVDIRERLIVNKNNRDSVTYPGEKEVTCELRVPITGSVADNYRFQVEITPDVTGLPESATAVGDPMPPLALSATALYDQAENGHQLDFPESSGQLTVDIHVTGNPGPNRFSLSVADDQGTAGVPLASGNGYEVTYTASVGAEGGVLSLLVKSGMDQAGVKFFTFKADNGVVGGAEFEYRFSVKGLPIATTTDTNADDDDDDDDDDVGGGDHDTNKGHKDDDSSSSDNIGYIIGLSVCGVAVVALIAILAIVFYRRRARATRGQDNTHIYATARPPGRDSHTYPNMSYDKDEAGYEHPPPYRSKASGEYDTVFDPPIPGNGLP